MRVLAESCFSLRLSKTLLEQVNGSLSTPKQHRMLVTIQPIRQPGLLTTTTDNPQ